jgi:hypothetical protein
MGILPRDGVRSLGHIRKTKFHMDWASPPLETSISRGNGPPRSWKKAPGMWDEGSQESRDSDLIYRDGKFIYFGCPGTRMLHRSIYFLDDPI